MSLLRVDDLTVASSVETILADVSLDVDADETVLVAGPSGSGKTTLARAIGGHLAARSHLETSGTVETAGDVGVLAGDPKTHLVRRSVERDLAFGLENRGVPRTEMERRIDAWADRLDAGHLLDRRVDSLSRGETTVVALLGILVTEPDLIVLDEPLAPLDRENRRLVRRTLRTLSTEDVSLLLTEHDLRDVLTLADRAVLLENGRVTARGSPRSLAPRLRRAGLSIPFATAVALERGVPRSRIPLRTSRGETG